MKFVIYLGYDQSGFRYGGGDSKTEHARPASRLEASIFRAMATFSKGFFPQMPKHTKTNKPLKKGGPAIQSSPLQKEMGTK